MPNCSSMLIQPSIYDRLQRQVVEAVSGLQRAQRCRESLSGETLRLSGRSDGCWLFPSVLTWGLCHSAQPPDCSSGPAGQHLWFPGAALVWAIWLTRRCLLRLGTEVTSLTLPKIRSGRFPHTAVSGNLLAVSVILAIGHCVAIPPGEGADETPHFDCVCYVKGCRALAAQPQSLEQGIDIWTGRHPWLYYALGAIAPQVQRLHRRLPSARGSAAISADCDWRRSKA